MGNIREKTMTFKEMDRLASLVGEKIKDGGCLGLIGGLGTGKTTFTKRICQEYGISENVKSPTFTYVISYTSGKRNVHHFDAYRIDYPAEIYETGFGDYIGEEDSVVIVEWADNIADEMPEYAIYVDISYDSEETRKVSVYKLKDGEREYVDFSNDYDYQNGVSLTS